MKSNVVVKKQSFFGRLALVTVTTLALVAGVLPGCAAQEEEQDEQYEEATGQSEQAAVGAAWYVLAAFQGVATVYMTYTEQKKCLAARAELIRTCKNKSVKIECFGNFRGKNTPAAKIPLMCNK